MILTNRRRLFTLSIFLPLIIFASGCRRRMAPPQPYLALVVNQKGQSIAVANLARFSLDRIISLGFQPQKIVVRPHSSEAFVTSSDGHVAVIRFPRLSIAATLQIGGGPNQWVFEPDGVSAYALGAAGRMIFKIDCKTLRVSEKFNTPLPLSSITFDPERRLIIGESAGGKLLLISAGSGKVTGSAEIPADAGSVVIARDGGKAFVAAESEHEILAVDLASGQILSRIDVGSRPSLLALKPDGGELFAFSGPDSTITILNASDDSVEESHPSGAGPAAAIFSRDSRWLYIANAGGGSVTRFDVENRREFSTHVGIRPEALALTPDERFLAVVDSASDRLCVVRAATGDLIASIPVGADPVDIVIPGWMGAGRTGE